MSFAYTRLSDTTLSTIKNTLSTNRQWLELSSDEKMAFINDGIIKVGRKKNTLDKKAYRVDTVADADSFLAPTLAGLVGIYSAYCKIKFDAYDAGSTNIISYVEDTQVLIYPDEENYEADATDDTNIVYTIPMLGATLDKTYKVLPPIPSYIDLEVSGNNIIVTVEKNHVAFDIEIEKKKES